MNDVVTLFGARLFSLSAPLFGAALGLAVLAWERAEARARARDDARYLCVSLALAAALAVPIDVVAADGFAGVAGLVMEATLAAAGVGLFELCLVGWGARGAVTRLARLVLGSADDSASRRAPALPSAQRVRYARAAAVR